MDTDGFAYRLRTEGLEKGNNITERIFHAVGPPLVGVPQADGG